MFAGTAKHNIDLESSLLIPSNVNNGQIVDCGLLEEVGRTLRLDLECGTPEHAATDSWVNRPLIGC